MNAKAALALVVFLGGAALYQASNWWGRAYATLKRSELSPDGCIRINTYEPFWITPSEFHRAPHAGSFERQPLGRTWDAAIFKRAFEERTGAFLGETVIYDPVASYNITLWNEAREPGRRIVLTNGFQLLDSNRCADTATLAKLEAYHEKRREENRAIQEEWEKERDQTSALSDPEGRTQK
jgi:hypothetical protein